MTKSKGQKARARALAAAVPAATAPRRRKKKSVLKKIGQRAGQVASIAGDLAPMAGALLPLLLGGGRGGARGTLPVALPAAQSSMVGASTSFSTKSEGRSLIVASSDIVATVEIPSTGKQAGEVLAAIELDPYSPSFAGTRLQKIAQTYQQYKVRRGRMIYVPAAPSLAIGQLVIFTTSDPDESLTETGFTGAQSALAHVGACETPVWQQAQAGYYPVPDRVFYSSSNNSSTTDPDELDLEERQTSGGQGVVVSSSELNGFTDGVTTSYTYGQLVVDWEIEFFNPSLDNSGEELGWAGKATATTLTTMTAGQPMAAAGGSDGLDGWADPIVSGAVAPAPARSAQLRYSDANSVSRLYNFPVGYWVSYCDIKATGGNTPASPVTFGDYEAMVVEVVNNTTVECSWFSMIYVNSRTSDPDDGWVLPINFTNIPIGRTEARMVWSKIGSAAEIRVPAMLPAGRHLRRYRQMARVDRMVRKSMRRQMGMSFLDSYKPVQRPTPGAPEDKGKGKEKVEPTESTPQLLRQPDVPTLGPADYANLQSLLNKCSLRNA